MFRGAVRGDLPQILKIYARARAVMKASGNPTQWGDNFPPQELLEEDIDSNRLFLYVVNGQIEAVFAFILGADPTYAAIEDGQWLGTSLSKHSFYCLQAGRLLCESGISHREGVCGFSVTDRPFYLCNGV